MSRKIDVEALCAEKGLRITEQRRVIARVLSDAEDHPDVEALHARAAAIDPGISIATVYRTVRLFEEAGILERHDFGDGRARYEAAAEAHHDHLIDVETGRVIEFVDPELEELQRRIAERLGFRLVDHRMELYGVVARSAELSVGRHGACGSGCASARAAAMLARLPARPCAGARCAGGRRRGCGAFSPCRARLRPARDGRRASRSTRDVLYRRQSCLLARYPRARRCDRRGVRLEGRCRAAGRWSAGWRAQAGTIFVAARRAAAAVRGQADALGAALASGRPAALFPKGRPATGDALLPFRASLLAAVERAPPGAARAAGGDRLWRGGARDRVDRQRGHRRQCAARRRRGRGGCR